MADTTRSRVRAWINASRALGVVRSLRQAKPADPTFEPVAPDPEVLAAIESEAHACQRRLDRAATDLRLWVAEVHDDVPHRTYPYSATDRDAEERVLASLGETTEVLGDPWVAALVVFGGGAADVDASGKASRSAVDAVAP